MLQNQIDLGQRIKTLRKEKGIRQKDFACQLNVSAAAVSRWENGDNLPDVYTLLQIANILGISLPELIDENLTADASVEQPIEIDSESDPNALQKKDKKRLPASVKHCFVIVGVLLILLIVWISVNSYRSKLLLNVHLFRLSEYVHPVYGQTHQTSYCFTGGLTQEKAYELSHLFYETELENGCFTPGFDCALYEFRFYPTDNPEDLEQWIYDIFILKE